MLHLRNYAAHDMRSRFNTQPTLDGYVVVTASDGRPVTESYPLQVEATEVAARLSLAAEGGYMTLERALAQT